ERRHARTLAKPSKQPPRWQRELNKGSARTTFVIGALLTLPGASYLAGLHSLHKLEYPTIATVLVVIGFNLVMLWILEVPLGSFLDRKSTRLNSSHGSISYAVFCLKKTKRPSTTRTIRQTRDTERNMSIPQPSSV